MIEYNLNLIRNKFELKDSKELLEIWVENDRKVWSDEAFQIIKQLLLERGEKLPPQKIKEKSIKISEIEIQKRMKFVITSNIVLGCINTIIWLIFFIEDSTKFINESSVLSEFPFWYWISLYAGLIYKFLLYGGSIIAISYLVCGVIGLINRPPIIISLNRFYLQLIGVWNILSGFLAILALIKYGHSYTINKFNMLLFIVLIGIGILQLYWVSKLIDNYSKVPSTDS